MKLKGTQILEQVLKEEGVEVIFGLPGGTVIDIYDELMDSDIRNIVVRHEQAAVHAADGYARAGGKVGVCLVTSGPGATNTVSGIASAYLDSVPIVVLCGQVPTHLIGNDAFQEVDISGITRPCTKHNYLVRRVEDLARVLKEAFHIARSGRPGPVLVDLPKDVMCASTHYRPVERVKLKSYRPIYDPKCKPLARAVELIRESRKPLILAGGGVLLSGASEQLRTFARKIRAPVTSTLMGLGAFPASDPLWLGMLGMHGTKAANLSTAACDLLIAVGARFDDRVTGKVDEFARQARIIHIDIDPTSIRKNVPVTVPVVGDCRLALQKLNALLSEGNGAPPGGRKAWLQEIEAWKRPQASFTAHKDVIKPQQVIESLHRLTNGQAIITTEVGQNQMWTAQYYPFSEPNRFITSGGLGCMGFGFPAALGAQMACPDRLVVDVAGDGSIQMNIQELATAVQYGLPVKVVILNNGYLGMVRQWQELFYERRYAGTPMEVGPDFVKLAEAYGALGLRASTPAEVMPVLEKGLSEPRPVIMDFQVDREEGVYPMVPAGAPLTRMLEAPQGGNPSQGLRRAAS